MKCFFYIVFFLSSVGVGYAQAWQDSLRRGKELYEMGDFEQAYQTFLEAQRLAPSEVNLSKDIGNAAFRSQDYEMAKKAFHAAANASENRMEQSQYWHNIGNVHFETKKYHNAIESYKQALRADPNNEKARYNLAEAKRRIEQESEQQNKNQEQGNENQDENQDESQEGNSQEDVAQNNQDENQSNEENNSSASNSKNEQHDDFEGKLSERKEERILDDLLKKEIETQRRLREMESRSEKEQVKSGKKW